MLRDTRKKEGKREWLVGPNATKGQGVAWRRKIKLKTMKEERTEQRTARTGGGGLPNTEERIRGMLWSGLTIP